MTSDDAEGPWDLLGMWPVTSHPDHPLLDDHSAAVLDEAAAELTLLRCPAAHGNCLADLHVLVSLHAHLHAWIPVAVAGARSNGYSWAEIASQLEVTPATARRRHQADTQECPLPTTQ